MTALNKRALRERYSPKPVPKCHICGEEMTIQRMSASRITYGCTGEGDDGYFKFGRTFVDEHYEKSRVTVVDVSDPDVLALLDELEHYKSREERVTKLVLDNSTSWDALYEKLEAAERRIAELEARAVNLPKRSVGEVMHLSGFSRDYAEGWCAGNDNAIHEVRTAGIKVKES